MQNNHKLAYVRTKMAERDSDGHLKHDTWLDYLAPLEVELSHMFYEEYYIQDLVIHPTIEQLFLAEIH